MNLLKLYSHLLIAIVACSLLLSCKKDNDPPPPPPPPVDTLSAGWQKITISEAQGLLDIFFVNNNVGWVCGGPYLGKSTDGGLTWTKQTVAADVSNIYNLFFLDEQNGWAVQSNALYKTRNGGTSWQKITVSGIIEYGDLQFLNPRLGYLSSDKGLYRSIDSGLNWTKVPGNFTNGQSLHFTDSLTGWVTTRAKPAFTADAGNSFTVNNAFPVTDQYFVQFVDASNGWVSGNAGAWRTTDAGANWTRVVESAPLSDIHFFNKNDGYVCANTSVYKTTNGGQNLTRVAFVVGTHGFVELHFTDPNHGWAATWNNFILRYAQ